MNHPETVRFHYQHEQFGRRWLGQTCHAMGCRNILAYEPRPGNFSQLTKHVGDLPGVLSSASAS